MARVRPEVLYTACDHRKLVTLSAGVSVQHSSEARVNVLVLHTTVTCSIMFALYLSYWNSWILNLENSNRNLVAAM